MTEVWFRTDYRDGKTVILAKINNTIFETVDLNDEELKKFWEELK